MNVIKIARLHGEGEIGELGAGPWNVGGPPHRVLAQQRATGLPTVCTAQNAAFVGPHTGLCDFITSGIAKKEGACMRRRPSHH